MQSQIDHRPYLTPYTRAVAERGPVAEALLNYSTERQQCRFTVFGNTLALANKRIADLGSGRADFLEWMHQENIPFQHYVGVEAVEEFHTTAKARIAQQPRSNASLIHADFVHDEALFDRLVQEEDIDILLFSGSLNTFSEDLALAALERAWKALARKPGAAMAFNFLAGGGNWPRPGTDLPRRDCARWVAWALERTPMITFCEYYLGAHDATLVMLNALFER